VRKPYTGSEAAILRAEQLKRDLLAVAVQLELGRIEPDAARAEVGNVSTADALHASLADLDPQRLALGGRFRGVGAGSCSFGVYVPDLDRRTDWLDAAVGVGAAHGKPNNE
jgi:hypothetical protein